MMEAETPLLSLSNTVNDVVDWRGSPANRSQTGRWRSAFFIIGVEVTERFAYFGISANLIRYLKGPLGQSTAAAAANVNLWVGVAALLPLVGGFVADSFWGRYRTIIVSSLLYILGLGLLTLSAILSPVGCVNGQRTSPGNTSCAPGKFEIILFYVSLYLVAIGQGGHRPCVQAFGADQFDGQNPEECKAKSSFFNWWYFGLSIGPIAALMSLGYIQDNINWGLGFGIPCVSMAFALLVLWLGTKTYRYATNVIDQRSPFMRIGEVYARTVINWRIKLSEVAIEEGDQGAMLSQGSQQLRFLNKALMARKSSKEGENVCTIRDVEEAKALLRLFPIWTTCLIYAIVFAQSSTLFTEQGVTMERSFGLGLKIPPSSLQSFIGFSILLFAPVYDCVIVPLTRVFTKRPSGITMLQRIGIGILLSSVSMIVAALVEGKRLQTALEYGLLDMPNATVPMSIWWLAPQYLLFGIADVFTIVGLQEFFYDQVPNGLRSMGLSLYLSIFGVGNFLSSSLISLIQKATSGNDRDGWFPNNLNRAHLDYFYWLLAGLSVLQLMAYLYFSKAYIYAN